MRFSDSLPRTAPADRSRVRMWLLAAVTLLALTAGSWLGTPGAAAHGGPLGAQAGPTGGGGVYVYIFFQRDLHAVDELRSATVEAAGEDRSIGPIDLGLSTTSPGRWETPSDVLPDGRWSLTVSYVEADGTSGVIDQTVQVNVTGGAEVAPAVAAVGWWPLALLGGLVAFVVAIIVAISLRRRRTAADPAATSFDSGVGTTRSAPR